MKHSTLCCTETLQNTFEFLHLWILWMSFTVCLMYWMYSAMLWRSDVSQLLREGQAFMMKWHFADIKIGQFVLDVVECSCWDAVSYQDEKVHVFFSSDWPRIKPAGEGLWCASCQLHSLILLSVFQDRLNPKAKNKENNYINNSFFVSVARNHYILIE